MFKIAHGAWIYLSTQVPRGEKNCSTFFRHNHTVHFFNKWFFSGDIYWHLIFRKIIKIKLLKKHANCPLTDEHLICAYIYIYIYIYIYLCFIGTIVWRHVFNSKTPPTPLMSELIFHIQNYSIAPVARNLWSYLRTPPAHT